MIFHFTFLICCICGIPLIAGRNLTKFPLLMPKVHPKVAETYLCTPIKINSNKNNYIVEFEPSASAKTVHHMLLYGCETPGSSDKVWVCGEMAVDNPGLGSAPPCSKGSQVIYAWAKSAPKLELPKDVGFRVGLDSKIKYLVLQVHYATVDHIPKDGDNSGVIIGMTHQQQPRTAGVLLLGTGGIALPHSTTYFESACTINDKRKIHPFAFRTHTHELGRVVSGWQVKNKKNWKLIGKKDPQSPQMFYPVEDERMIITQGDVVAARCTMVNNRNWITRIGATNKDEMCNFYLMYWVEGSGDIVRPNTCFTMGPPIWSWDGYIFGANLQNVPDEAASTL